MSADRHELHRQLLDRVVETAIVVHCGGSYAPEQLERARAGPQAFDPEPAAIFHQRIGAV
jgi:hypothetical protein